MAAKLLFDQRYYERINEARWAVADRLLSGLAAVGTPALTTCLDVGCGPGWFAERLVARGFEVHGIDARRSTIEEARRRVAGARFSQVDAEATRALAALGRFDLVFCAGLLYHTENPFRVTRNLEAVTRHCLFLESVLLPGSEPLVRLVDESDNETQGLTRHALIPSLTALTKMLRAAGFEHVCEHVGSIGHEDFQETPSRRRRRRILLASRVPLVLPELAERRIAPAPKIDFEKAGTA